MWGAVYSATPSFHSFNFECCANMKVAKFSHLVVMAVTVCSPVVACSFAHFPQQLVPRLSTAFPTFQLPQSLIGQHILPPPTSGRNCDWSGGQSAGEKLSKNYELLFRSCSQSLFRVPVPCPDFGTLVSGRAPIATPQWSMLGF